jgi:hypothetical protein
MSADAVETLAEHNRRPPVGKTAKARAPCCAGAGGIMTAAE